MPDNTLIQTASFVSVSSGHGGACGLQEEVVRLFVHLRVPMLRYLHALGLPPAEGEDIAQDAFVQLFRHLRAGKPRDNLRAWLFRVAHNLALKRLRRVHTQLDVVPDWKEIPDGSANPEDQAALSQQQRSVRAVMDALPALDRQCMLLRAEGLPYREIAAALDISLGSVAASLSRTLARMARATQAEK